jgi:hypothetical protein
MISCQLRISFENLLDGLPCRELFEYQIDWNSCSLQACFAHHHIRANLDVLRQFHIPNCIGDSTTPQGSARPHAAPGAILTHQRMHFPCAQPEVRRGELRRRRSVCLCFRRGADPTEQDIEFVACKRRLRGGSQSKLGRKPPECQDRTGEATSSHSLHLVPIVSQFLAALQTGDVGPSLGL